MELELQTTLGRILINLRGYSAAETGNAIPKEPPIFAKWPNAIIDPGEGTTCWPAPEVTTNMNKSHVGNLGLSDADEDAIVAFLRTLDDGYFSRDSP